MSTEPIEEGHYTIEICKYTDGSAMIFMKASLPHDGIVTEHRLIEKQPVRHLGNFIEQISDQLAKPAKNIWLLGE